MSHTVTLRTEVRSRTALERAARRLGGTVTEGTHKFYNTSHQGLGVHLPGWYYPVVFANGERHIETGDVGEMEVVPDGVWYDSYRQKRQTLDKLMQNYTVEAIREQAMLQGHMVSEEVLANGDIKVLITEVA